MTKKEYIIQNAIDGFKNELMGEFITLCCENDYNKLTLLKIGDTIDRIYDEHIDKYANIDVAPVVHGQWINCKDGDATCSKCRTRQKHIYDVDNSQHYCGSCGAKMDGE